MRALIASGAPSELRAYAGILLRRRPGLRELSQMPRLERSLDARIDPAWLAAYREIVGETQSSEGTLPPLALQLAAAPLHLQLLADARFPFPALGIIHVGQSVEQREPLRADQPLELRASTTEAAEAKRGITFGLVTEARAEGELVWRGETTALVPQKRAHAEKKSKLELAAEPGWEPLASVRAAESLGRRYAAIANDRNPIHQHALLAKPFGFKRAIVHGTWTLARALAALKEPWGAYQLQARFLRPVFLPSEISIAARREEKNRYLRVTNAQGDITHLSAQISIG